MLFFIIIWSLDNNKYKVHRSFPDNFPTFIIKQFSIFSKHQNHLEGFIKMQISRPHLHSIWFSRLGWGLKFYISSKFLNNVHGAHLGTILWGPLHLKSKITCFTTVTLLGYGRAETWSQVVSSVYLFNLLFPLQTYKLLFVRCVRLSIFITT